MAAGISGTSVRRRHISECPETGPICLVRDEPPQEHDQRISLVDLRLDATLGLAQGWGVALGLPLRLVDTAITYRDLSGRPITLDYEDIHHRTERLAGPGDPSLTAVWSASPGRWTLGARAGASLPLGRTEEDPNRAALEGEKHQHIQFGTGTVDPVLAAQARRAWESVEVSGWALAAAPLYQNHHGYRAGRRFAAGLGVQSALGLQAWRFEAALDVQGETAEAWAGEVAHGEHMEGNRGRIDVLVGAGATWEVGGIALRLALKTPIITRVVGEQLSYPVVVDLGLSPEPLQLWGGRQ